MYDGVVNRVNVKASSSQRVIQVVRITIDFNQGNYTQVLCHV